jgi:TRAP-type C4-dicarboxylate transport system permease small subunit
MRRRVDWVAALEGLSSALILGAALMAFVNVVTRKVFSRPFSWSDELVGFMIVCTVYLALPRLERGRAHLRVSALYDVLPPRVRWWLDRVSDVVVMGFMLYFAYVAWGVARTNFELNVHSPTLAIPMGLLYGVIPLAFVLSVVARGAAVIPALRGSGEGPR